METWASRVLQTLRRSRLWLGLLGLCLSVSGVQVSAAALYEAGNNYDSYGHVYQYDVPVIGPMACCPTSAANSFNYLQNRFPAVYGSVLTSSPPTTADVQVIGGAQYMNTDRANGTTDALSVWGRYLYIESRRPFQTEYSCQVAIVNGQPVSDHTVIPWPDNRPIPTFLNNTPGAVSVPTWQFLYQNLQRGADVGLAISYLEGGVVTGGHCVTVHRISFDDRNNNGIIDPGEGSISLVNPARRTEITYDLRQNQDLGTLNGHSYLIVDYDGRTAFIQVAVAEYPSPQAVPGTIGTGGIAVLRSDSPYGVLTFQGGVLYAAESETTWNKAMVLGGAGGIFDSATNDLTLTGAVSGTGNLNKMGTGTLFLRGSNTYTGGTILTEGTVSVVSDANLGSPAGALRFKGGTLQAGADLESSRPMVAEFFMITYGEGSTIPGTSYFDTGVYHSTFSGQFSGSGNLTQTGQGSLTLTANSRDFKGNYIVQSGTLNIEGTLSGPSSSMTIDPGGTLKGSGLLGISTTNYGTVAPGASVGTLTIDGGYFQKPGGRLEVEIASAASYDKLRVTGLQGAAGLDGTLKPVILGGYRPPVNTVFPGIVQADLGIFNTAFAAIENTPVLSWQAAYSENQVDLTLVGRDYAKSSIVLNANQRAVGNMLNGIADTTTGDLARVLNTLDGLPAARDVADAYRQISPEKDGVLPALGLAGSALPLRSISDRLTWGRWSRGRSSSPRSGNDPGSFNLRYSEWEGVRLAYNATGLGNLIGKTRPATQDQGPWEVFADFVGASGTQDGSETQIGYHFNVFGLAAGADYRLSGDWLLGLGSGFYRTRASFDAGGGSSRVRNLPFFTYAAYTPGDFYAMGSLGYTLNWYEIDRNVSFGGLGRTASRSVNGGAFNTALETGYDFRFTRTILTPAATLFYSRIRVDGFTETGADALNLSVDSQTAESLQGGIGFRAARPFRACGTDGMAQVSAFYQHEFSNNSRGVNARLVQGGASFTIQTDRPRRDLVVLGGGLAFNISSHLSLHANYNAELGGSEYTAHLVSAGIKWEF